MTQGYFVTGTDTGIGKTWSTVALMQYFKNQGLKKRLTTKGQLQALLGAYPMDKDGQITASYEVIYVRAISGEGL